MIEAELLANEDDNKEIRGFGCKEDIDDEGADGDKDEMGADCDELNGDESMQITGLGWLTSDDADDADDVAAELVAVFLFFLSLCASVTRARFFARNLS